MRNILVRLVCSVMVLMFLAFGLAPSKCQAQTQVQKLMDQGTKQMQNQKYDQAIATFKKALKEEPKSAALYNLLGMAYRFKYNQVRNQKLKQQEIAAFKKATRVRIKTNMRVILLREYRLDELSPAAIGSRVDIDQEPLTYYSNRYVACQRMSACAAFPLCGIWLIHSTPLGG